MNKPQRGFTLVEMMVTVAIIGVLAGISAVMLRFPTSAADVSDQAGALMREAARKAVAGGRVRSDVATALGSTARARFEVSAADVNGGRTMSLQVLQEDPLPANTAQWLIVQSETLPIKLVTLAGTTDSAVLTDGGAPQANTSPTSTIDINFYPDGRADAVTFYFQTVNGSATAGGKFARAVVLPLGGAVTTFARW